LAKCCFPPFYIPIGFVTEMAAETCSEENPMNSFIGEIEIAPCGSGYCINMKPPSDQSATGAK